MSTITTQLISHPFPLQLDNLELPLGPYVPEIDKNIQKIHYCPYGGSSYIDIIWVDLRCARRPPKAPI